ncbi:MAG: hypothetical protein ABSH08_15955 [Tepidisphaeraceae bacterium]
MNTAITGKTVECACGAVLTGAEAGACIAGADPYNVAEPSAGIHESSIRDATAKRPTASTTSDGGRSAQVLDYAELGAARNANRFCFDNLLDPVRDFYVPLILLVGGFLAALAWVILQTAMGTKGLVIMSLVVGLAVLLKTTVLVALALWGASKLDVSLGLVGPAILKFAGMIISIDSTRLWLNLRGRLDLGFVLVMILCLSCYLFDLADDDARIFRMVLVPIAIIWLLIDILLKWAVVAGLHAILLAP